MTVLFFPTAHAAAAAADQRTRNRFCDILNNRPAAPRRRRRRQPGPVAWIESAPHNPYWPKGKPDYRRSTTAHDRGAGVKRPAAPKPANVTVKAPPPVKSDLPTRPPVDYIARHPEAADLLRAGASIAVTANRTGIRADEARRVKKALQTQHQDGRELSQCERYRVLYPAVIEALKTGASLRAAGAAGGVSYQTAGRVKKACIDGA